MENELTLKEIRELGRRAEHLSLLCEKTDTNRSLSNDNKLRLLQFVEGGLIDFLPLAPIIVASKKYPMQKECICCGFEYGITHHIYTPVDKGRTSTNGGYKDGYNYIGVTRVCPNCHLLIHQKNPFTIKSRPDLYTE